MKIKQTIGIDISKLTFDVRIHSNQCYQAFENNLKGFKALIKWVEKNNSISKEHTLFVLEHTGIYSEEIASFFDVNNFYFALIPGLEIKKSLGISRGKDDKVDATKIALYGYRLRDEIKPYKLPSKNIHQLKRLLTLRERLVKQNAGYKATLKEQKRVYTRKENQLLLETQEKMIKYFTKQIKSVEAEMNKIIKASEQLKKQYKLIVSIKGIGNQTALFMIVTTNGFTKFASWRKFASYCGIAPFPNTSGTSIRGRTKVSNLANKKLKSLFDMCAKSAIQHNPEMKLFYNRRVEQGKNKMSTINIIRNKLLSRIFAAIKRQTPYVNVLKYAA
ncbi:IS110 family transposase [Polaribacter sp. Q13]|uniref:IS110 family transposase n=1 Tax=Polaribacter sp. Q13 TaxID=2806551 RepID=UPI001C00F685|nr:IS110 family transposase [Polaribacter sp. Q13]QVY64576.1 IS110 family transposase [Polaribacter sp. Q13]QVY64597.1 IS110 family transposase [Polaribacter sp. Q13]